MTEELKKKYERPCMQVVEIECESSCLAASTESNKMDIERSNIEYEEW